MEVVCEPRNPVSNQRYATRKYPLADPYAGGVWNLDVAKLKGDAFYGLASCDAELCTFRVDTASAGAASGGRSGTYAVTDFTDFKVEPVSLVLDCDDAAMPVWSAAVAEAVKDGAESGEDAELRAAHDKLRAPLIRELDGIRERLASLLDANEVFLSLGFLVESCR